MTHEYTGPTTRAGLRRGTRVKIIGKRAGGKVCLDKNRERWLISPRHLEKV